MTKSEILDEVQDIANGMIMTHMDFSGAGKELHGRLVGLAGKLLDDIHHEGPPSMKINYGSPLVAIDAGCKVECVHPLDSVFASMPAGSELILRKGPQA